MKDWVFAGNRTYQREEIEALASTVSEDGEYLIALTPVREYWFLPASPEGYKLDHTWVKFVLAPSQAAHLRKLIHSHLWRFLKSPLYTSRCSWCGRFPHRPRSSDQGWRGYRCTSVGVYYLCPQCWAHVRKLEGYQQLPMFDKETSNA
jgi:DNA-directed RNA polymerase subunit RPC12/RpoP